MTDNVSLYAEAFYTLAREESLCDSLLRQLRLLDTCFTQTPVFPEILDAPGIPKAERLQLLDRCFAGKLEPYLLNFLKILTEKRCMRRFSTCVQVYTDLYNRDKGILPVCAVTAVPLSATQTMSLTEKLSRITGRQITLSTKLDPAVLGGVRLDFDGRRVDGTVSRRLHKLGAMLENSQL